MSQKSSRRSQTSLELRARQLREMPIEYIAGKETAAATKNRDLVDAMLADGDRKLAAELPAHLRRMCDPNLLTREQERALFAAMNAAKQEADRLREKIDPRRPAERRIVEIEQRLQRAEQIRDHLIKSNMRLVMSIAKKFVTPQVSFDELLSDGIVSLIQSVAKFDVERGFRFSTYAYYSIARNAHRSVQKAHKEEARYTRVAETWAFQQEDDQANRTDHVWNRLQDLLSTMISKLNPRERFVIHSRYALGAQRSVRTLQALGTRLGISKERVRQLERRAVEKLRGLAAEHELDDLFAVAVV